MPDEHIFQVNHIVSNDCISRDFDERPESKIPMSVPAVKTYLQDVLNQRSMTLSLRELSRKACSTEDKTRTHCCTRLSLGVRLLMGKQRPGIEVRNLLMLTRYSRAVRAQIPEFSRDKSSTVMSLAPGSVKPDTGWSPLRGRLPSPGISCSRRNSNWTLRVPLDVSSAEARVVMLQLREDGQTDNPWPVIKVGMSTCLLSGSEDESTNELNAASNQQVNSLRLSLCERQQMVKCRPFQLAPGQGNLSVTRVDWPIQQPLLLAQIN